MLSNSRGAGAVRDMAERLGCRAGTEDAARFGEVVWVSVPLRAFASLLGVVIGGHIVVDTCSYYPERDGVVPGLESGAEATSGLLQKTLPQRSCGQAVQFGSGQGRCRSAGWWVPCLAICR